MVALYLGLSAVCMFGCGLSAVLTWALGRKGHQEELVRLMYAHEQAMLFLRAGSAIEKVQADSSRKSADLQLKILEDALAMEQDKTIKDEKELNPEHKWVSGFDAQGEPVEVDLNAGWQIQE